MFFFSGCDLEAQSPDYRHALLQSPENRLASASSPAAFFTNSGQSLKYNKQDVAGVIQPHSPEMMRMDFHQAAVQSPEVRISLDYQSDVQSPEFSGGGELVYSPVTIQEPVQVGFYRRYMYRYFLAIFRILYEFPIL